MAARRLRIIAIVVGLTMAAACTTSKAVVKEPVPSPAATAAAAIYLTAHAGDAADGNGGGVVVSVGADGSIVGQTRTKGIKGWCPGSSRGCPLLL